MKKYTFPAILILSLSLTACSGTTDSVNVTPAVTTTATQQTTTAPAPAATTTAAETAPTESTPSGYLFSPVDGIELFMHSEAEDALQALGEPLSCLEAASCAFQGTDRIYNFGGYEITTYEKGNREYIYDIYLLDDSVTTAEGIYIGCSKADMEQAYGTAYEETAGSYTYRKDGMTLQFLTENDMIIAIRYNGATE